MALNVLKDANVEIGRDFRILADDAGVGRVGDAIADQVPDLVVGRRNE